jgi:hypothetical protein
VSALAARPGVATTFLRWTFTRATFHRGYVLVSGLYFVIGAHLSAFQLIVLGTVVSATLLSSDIPAGRAAGLATAIVASGAAMAVLGIASGFPLAVVAQAAGIPAALMTSGALITCVGAMVARSRADVRRRR